MTASSLHWKSHVTHCNSGDGSRRLGLVEPKINPREIDPDTGGSDDADGDGYFEDEDCADTEAGITQARLRFVTASITTVTMKSMRVCPKNTTPTQTAMDLVIPPTLEAYQDLWLCHQRQ